MDRDALAGWLAQACGADRVRITALDKLAGGAIQENWGLTVEAEGGDWAGRHDCVLRTDAPSAVSASHTRLQEFALLKAARAAGVMAPRPLFACAEAGVTGRPFYIMARVGGRAEGHILVRDTALMERGDALVERLGREMARIHAITPPRDDLGFRKVPDGPPAVGRIATYRG